MNINPIETSAEKPLWSVMIPVYNRVNYLEQCIASVLAQDPGPDVMQIEVIDNKSTTVDMKKIVRDLGKGRIEYSCNPTNIGIINNFSMCPTRARGQLVHILHDDDYVLPGFYDRLGAAFQEDSSIGAAFCRYAYIDASGKEIGISALETATPGIIPNFLDRLFVWQKIEFVSIVVKREVYEKLGKFDENFMFCADWDMWKKIAANYPIWFEPQLLAHYRMHDDAGSSLFSKKFRHVSNIWSSIERTAHLIEPSKREALICKARDRMAERISISDTLNSLLADPSGIQWNRELLAGFAYVLTHRIRRRLGKASYGFQE